MSKKKDFLIVVDMQNDFVDGSLGTAEAVSIVAPAAERIRSFDGEILYAHTNYRGSLHYRKDENGVTVSTQPLSRENWKNMPLTTLLGFKNGELVFTGTNHGNEYFFDQSAYEPLYLAYSGL